ncbi:hypothetical protein FACS189452_05580 [Bacteroidia bacterium]|nr:hypothetical protein FACS189452_05580 [Bacteroidia bacterium]
MITPAPIDFANTLLHPYFIKNTDGQDLVAFSQQEFETILDTIEDWEDTELYDQAMKEDTGERIPMEDVFQMIEAKRKAS